MRCETISGATNTLWAFIYIYIVVLFADKFLSKEIGFITKPHSIPIDKMSKMSWHGNTQRENLNAHRVPGTEDKRTLMFGLKKTFKYVGLKKRLNGNCFVYIWILLTVSMRNLKYIWEIIQVNRN